MGRMLFTLLLLGAVMTGAAVANDAKAVAEKHRWNLDDLYPTTAEFDTARKALAGRLPGLEEHRGRLSASPARMKAAFDSYFAVAKDLNRISSFAGMRSDEDTRVAATLGARQEVQQLSTEFAARTSWLAPEVLALPAGTVEKFLAAEPGLAPTGSSCVDLERQRAHTLSPGARRSCWRRPASSLRRPRRSTASCTTPTCRSRR